MNWRSQISIRRHAFSLAEFIAVAAEVVEIADVDYHLGGGDFRLFSDDNYLSLLTGGGGGRGGVRTTTYFCSRTTNFNPSVIGVSVLLRAILITA